MREYNTKNSDVTIVAGEWGVWHRYTYGVAGEKFFREMKDHGRLVASLCPKCQIAVLPANQYCENCFAEMTEHRPVGDAGTVYSFTVLRESLDEAPLAEPLVVALVRFEGVTGGWLAPLKGVPADQVRVGQRVKCVWRPPGERRGELADLAHFAPA